MAWSEAQQMALALVPKFSSIFSLFGSFWISIEVLTDTTSAEIPKRKHPYHRLLLAMSIYDILESFWNFLSTWPIPRDTEGVWHPRGTTRTCTAQGFFLTLSVAVPIYNAMLSLYYLLVIKYSISDETLRKVVEPAMHGIAFFWAFGTALVSAWMGLINNANLWCWIAPYPAGCKDSRRYGDEANCERGDNAWIYRWAFYFAPLWFCIAFATVCTILVYFKVYKYDQISLKYRKPERVSFMGARLANDPRNKTSGNYLSRNSVSSSRSSFSRNVADAARGFHRDDDNSDDSETENPAFVFEGLEQIAEEENLEADEPPSPHSHARRTSFSELRASFTTTGHSIVESINRYNQRRKEFAEDNPRTTEVFHQALWYLLTFYVTHVWSTSNRIVQQINNGKTHFGLILIHSFFDPLQGFLNFLVYQRPRYIRMRKENPGLSRWRAMIRVLRFSYLPELASTKSKKEMNFSSRTGPDSIAAPPAGSINEVDDNFGLDLNDCSTSSKRLGETSECEPIPEEDDDDTPHNPAYSTQSFSESLHDELVSEMLTGPISDGKPPSPERIPGDGETETHDATGDAGTLGVWAVVSAGSFESENKEEEEEVEADGTEKESESALPDHGNLAQHRSLGAQDNLASEQASANEETKEEGAEERSGDAGSVAVLLDRVSNTEQDQVTDVVDTAAARAEALHEIRGDGRHREQENSYPHDSDTSTQDVKPTEEPEEHTIEFVEDTGAEEDEQLSTEHILSSIPHDT